MGYCGMCLRVRGLKILESCREEGGDASETDCSETPRPLAGRGVGENGAFGGLSDGVWFSNFPGSTHHEQQENPGRQCIERRSQAGEGIFREGADSVDGGVSEAI